MEPFQIASLALGGAAFLGNLGQSIFGNRANRNFQAQQAQIARDWQEDYYNKYSSPSAMVQQFKDAGLNPAMMYGRGSSVVGGVPSGASPSGGSQMQSDLSGLGQLIPSIVELKEMIDNNKSQRNVNSALANYYNSQSNLAESSIELNSANKEKINSEIEYLSAQTKNEQDRNALIALENTFKSLQNQSISYDNLKKKWEEDFKQRFGAYPADNAYQAFQRVLMILEQKLGIIDYFSGR